MRSDEVRVGKRSNAKSSMRRDHKATRCQISVSGIDDRVEHGFEQKTVTHPLGHDNVDLWNGKSNLFYLSPNTSESSTVSD